MLKFFKDISTVILIQECQELSVAQHPNEGFWVQFLKMAAQPARGPVDCLPCKLFSEWSVPWYRLEGATFPRVSLLQVQKYERLTPISVLDRALESLDNLQPGDCIVCFSKNDIYSVSRQIEIRGLESAVIYGSLPPGNH